MHISFENAECVGSAGKPAAALIRPTKDVCSVLKSETNRTTCIYDNDGKAESRDAVGVAHHSLEHSARRFVSQSSTARRGGFSGKMDDFCSETQTLIIKSLLPLNKDVRSRFEGSQAACGAYTDAAAQRSRSDADT